MGRMRPLCMTGAGGAPHAIKDRRQPAVPERLNRRAARRGLSREKDAMTEETATNPVEGEDNAAANLPDTQEVEPQAVDNESGPEPEESEEIEHDGRKYLVPKALRPLLLMQADYTRKTQEVAEQRRAV